MGKAHILAEAIKAKIGAAPETEAYDKAKDSMIRKLIDAGYSPTSAIGMWYQACLVGNILTPGRGRRPKPVDGLLAKHDFDRIESRVARELLERVGTTPNRAEYNKARAVVVAELKRLGYAKPSVYAILDKARREAGITVPDVTLKQHRKRREAWLQAVEDARRNGWPAPEKPKGV